MYFKGKATVNIEAETPGATIHYTLDGSEPTVTSPVYAGPITLDRSATIRALAARNGRQSVISQPVRFERLVGTKDIVVRPDPAPEYAGHGPLTLVDGQRGAPGALGNEWLGFEGKDMEVVMDLGEAQPVKAIAAGFLSDQGRWVFLPGSVEYAVGTTREKMQVVFSEEWKTGKVEQGSVKDVSAKIKPVRARYVRVRAKNVGVCPPWHPGAGGKAWLFVDEITVR